MNAEIEQALTDSLNKIVDWMEGTESFVLEQAPDVIQQLLAWELVQMSIGAVICTVVFVFFLGLARYAYGKVKAKVHGDWHVGVGFSLAGATLAFIPFGICVARIVKVYVAPKLVILEALRGLF